MRKVSAFLSLLLICVTCVGLCLFITGCGEDVEDGFVFEVVSGTKDYRIIGVKDKSVEAINIPVTHKEHNVIAIGENAFKGCKKVTSIVIPDNITSIGANAFANTGITPKEESAYGYKTIDGWIVEVTDKSSASVKISADVRGVAYNAYDGITATEVDYEGDIAKWCAIKFSTGKANPLHAARTLKIGGNAVTDLKIPESVEKISFAAFYGSNIESVDFGSGVTAIGNGAFSECEKLTSVTIPANVISVGSTAFYGCKALVSVTLSEGLTEIGNGAFMACENITEIAIPASVDVMGTYVFNECAKLENITVAGKAKRGKNWAESWANGSAANNNKTENIHWDENAETQNGENE